MTEIQNIPAGILLVNKSRGWSSFDVVAKVRSLIAKDIGIKPKRLKVGHSGTLDPEATGLLIVAVGASTKKLPDLLKVDKEYVVEATLGSTSETGDRQGPITNKHIGKPPSEANVMSILDSFIGEIEQIPPKYSAIKVNGRRAYDMARQGIDVKLQPRTITIHSISNIIYSWPIIKFTAHVSSGTYIRTLVEDIGVLLETGAYMSDLTRTKVADYILEDAVQDIKKSTAEELIAQLH